MRVALVWPTIDAKRASADLRKRISYLAKQHDVDMWTHPAAVSRLRRRLPGLESVQALTHPDTASRLGSLDSDLIVVFHPSTARKAAKHASLDVPLVYWSHAAPRMMRSGDPRPDGLDVLSELASRMDAVLCDSAEHRHELIDRLGPHSVAVMSTTSIAMTVRPPSAADGRRLAVAAGALHPSAGFGDVIRAFDEAGVAAHGWRMVLRGEGRHQEKLDQLVRWRELESSVTFQAENSLDASLESASLLLTPGTAPTHEALALEAAARGVPVVGYVGDPIAGLIADAGGGILVPAGAPQALGAAVAHLASDSDVLANYGAKARDAAAALSAEGTEQWTSALEGLVRQHSRRSRHGEVETTDLTRDGARRRDELNAAVSRVLDDAEIAYARVSGTSGNEIPVAGAEDVATVIDALVSADVGSLRLYVGNDPAHIEPITTSENVPAFVAAINRVDVMNPGEGGSVSIDFWRETEDGVRHAPRRNAEADWVGRDAWSGWTEASRRTVTGLPLWHSVDFAVDAVFTWVDGDDPAWRARRDEHLPGGSPELEPSRSNGASDDRFINRDEIYYSVAAARKYLPWLRRIIIVVDGQRHDRIQADFPEVEFVDHKTIFPDPGVLPVFNSHAIEACLHRIPGLADRFLYFNDDVFVTTPLSPTAFFETNGVARFFPSELKVNFGDAGGSEPHLRAAGNNRQLIATDFGVEITNTMLHTPHPHVRSVLEEMDERYAAEFAHTRSSRFRDNGDISVLSSFAQYYGWATRNYVPGTLEYRFVRLHAKDLESRLTRVSKDKAVQVVCLGEPMLGQQRHEDEFALTRRFMERLIAAESASD